VYITKAAIQTWTERFEGYTGTYEAGEFDTSSVIKEKFWD
jgi:hypothetical protein